MRGCRGTFDKSCRRSCSRVTTPVSAAATQSPEQLLLLSMAVTISVREYDLGGEQIVGQA
jgi:hypothetical protein